MVILVGNLLSHFTSIILLMVVRHRIRLLIDLLHRIINLHHHSKRQIYLFYRFLVLRVSSGRVIFPRIGNIDPNYFSLIFFGRDVLLAFGACFVWVIRF
jgi:hypothetical protein